MLRMLSLCAYWQQSSVEDKDDVDRMTEPRLWKIPLGQLALNLGVEPVFSHLHEPGRRLRLAYNHCIIS